MKKRILSLMMAAVLATAAVPMMASATDTTTADTSATDASTTGEDVTGEGQGAVGSEETTTGAADAASGAMDSNTTESTTTDGFTGTEDEGVEPISEEGAEVEKDEADETKEAEVVSGKVVTLGENLSEDQRNLMYQYFGVSSDEVHTIIVTHQDEVNYMQGIATSAQIGATTNSCAYVEPTESGGIKVKTANLNFVTSEMIASTLTTAGMENCNVVAACPFEVSGTGALTGIIMAYESASGDVLDAGKKEAAMTEMVLLGELAEVVGEETATELLNIAKTEIIDKGITDATEIGAIVDDVAADYGVTLTEDQRSQIVSFLQMMSKYDYDLDALQNTLDNLNKTVSGLSQAWNNIKSFFFGSGDGILTQTNDSVLGENVITDSNVATSKYADGLFTRIVNFFKGE